jgi:imidazolonepropionase-like amidohydrolase
MKSSTLKPAAAALFAVAGLLFPGAVGAAQGDAVGAGLAPFVTVNAKTVAIEHVRVIDGTGARATRDSTVVFSGGIITAYGSASGTPIPAGATRIDGSGKSLLPGYVGMHNHLFTGVNSAQHIWRSMPFSFPRLYLAAGTTTIRTTGSMDIYSDLSAKRAVDAGEAPGPHIDATSPYLTGLGNLDPQMDELRDAADARATVDFWADRGVTSYKVYTDITRDELAAVIDEAHKRGLKVMGHLCSVGYRDAAALGIDELEHGPFFTDTDFVDSKKPDTCPSPFDQYVANESLDTNGPQVHALIADLIARRTPVSSTLPVFESFFMPRNVPDAEFHQTLDALDPVHRADIVRLRAGYADGSGYGPKTRAAITAHPNLFVRLFEKEVAFELAFFRAGGILTAGPDPSGYGAVIAGFGDWRELEILVQGGFSPLEAVRVATLNGAIALGRQAEIGSITVGKHADLTLVDGDPSTRIADISKVETVFKDGVGYDSKKLIESVRGVVGRE